MLVTFGTSRVKAGNHDVTLRATLRQLITATSSTALSIVKHFTLCVLKKSSGKRHSRALLNSGCKKLESRLLAYFVLGKPLACMYNSVVHAQRLPFHNPSSPVL